jgi:hypothetical protein
MVKQAALILSAVTLLAHAGVEEPDVLVRFNGGIGVTPVSNVAGVSTVGENATTFPDVAQNIVRGVVPAGPWRIEDLKATITTSGRIKVRGRGLLLAAGNRIGENANQSVFATLICEAAKPFVERSTNLTGVPLERNGDFRIDDELNPAPSECASPVLLIRSTTVNNKPWFAAGIPSFDDEEL